MDIIKGTRHQKIIGNCGEMILCNWLSRSGFEVTVVDHTGIDIVAYNPTTHNRLGITVKSRTRPIGKEEDSVNIFHNDKNDRQKVLAACEAFACEPWLAVYVEATDQADIYLTSLTNYDVKYRREGRAIDDWKMVPKYQETYVSDPLVKHIKINFAGINWTW